MKTLQFLALAMLFALSFTFASCGGSGHKHDQAKEEQSTTETMDKSGPEYTSAYICPMHCPGSGSDAAGQCPVCGMDYVANEAFKGDDHDHDDPDHQH